MNEKIIALYTDSVLQRIPFEDAKFKIRLEIMKEYFHREFEELFEEKNPEKVGILLFLPQWFGVDRMYLSFYNKLLIEPWYYEHECVIDILSRYHDESSSAYIEQAINANFDYMECDVNNCEGLPYSSFIRKCMWELADINTAESLFLLESFSKSDNPVISLNAKNQLHFALTGDGEMREMP